MNLPYLPNALKIINTIRSCVMSISQLNTIEICSNYIGYCHFILCECASLVGADDVHAAQCLDLINDGIIR